MPACRGKAEIANRGRHVADDAAAKDHRWASQVHKGPNSLQRQLTIVIGRFPPAEDGTVNVSSFQWHGAGATEPVTPAADRGCR